MNAANFGKMSLFVEQDHDQQTSTCLLTVRVNKWFKNVKNVGHIHFKKPVKFGKYIEIFRCCMTQEQEIRIIFIYKNCFKKGKYGTM